MAEYRALKQYEITKELFRHFDRYQDVKRCWRKEQGRWVLKDISFEENWDDYDIARLAERLKQTAEAGGTVFAAFEEDKLVGFSSLENERFGERKEYLQLSNVHVSYGRRGRGIGKALFRMAANRAREAGAGKLYISAHSSEETQAFYKSMGCAEAVFPNERLVVEEPYDCQLEYVL